MKTEKELEQERDELMQEAWDCDSKHCRSCDDMEVTPDMYGTGDSPTGYDCICPDSSRCRAVEAVYAEMEDLKQDDCVTETAIRNVRDEIIDYTDANNAGTLLNIISSALRLERFEVAKDKELI